MSTYLELLRTLEKNLHVPVELPTKPTKGASVGFVGTPPGHPQNFAPLDELARTWWWVYRNGRPLCQLMDPQGLTRAEALADARARWPDDDIDVPLLDLEGRVLQPGESPCP